MAITGTFLANFSTFYDAVQQATTKLRTFEDGAGTVSKQLTTMSNSLSGVKIVQQATIAAEAVERIGGASKLTEAELQRVASTASEAAAKLTAMGQQVPGQIANLAAEFKNVNTAQESTLGSLRSLIAGYVAMSTAKAVFSYAKNIVNEASALQDLSQQTHINVEEVQTLAGAMSEFGVDADTLAKGLYKLSRGIAGGDESVARGLHTMGMSLKDVDGLNGKELFLKIEAGLATLQGGLRDTAAADLFGGRLGAAMAGASEGIGDAIKKWEDFNTVAGKDGVAALDQFGESIARAEKSLNSMSTNVMGRTAQLFNTVTDALEKGGGKWKTFTALLGSAFEQQMHYGTGTTVLTRLLDDLNQKQEAAAAAAKKTAEAQGQVVGAIDRRTQAEKFMASLEADSAVTLNATQIKYLEHLKEIGQLNAANADRIGVNAGQYAKYTASLEAAKKAAEDLAKAEAIAARSQEAIDKLDADYTATSISRSGTRTETEIANIDRTYKTLVASLQRSGAYNAEVATAVDRNWAQALNGVGVNWDQLKGKSIEALTDTAQRAQATLNQMLSGAEHYSRAVIDEQIAIRNAAVDALHYTAAEHAAVFEHMRDDVDRASFEYRSWLANMATDAEKAAVALKGVKKATDDAAKAAADAAAKALANRMAGGSVDYGTVEGQRIAHDSHAATQQDYIARLGFQAGMQAWLDLQSAVSRGAKALHDQGVPGFLNGGPTGSGGLSMLHPDEFVVPKGGALVLNRDRASGVTVNMNVSGLLVGNSPSGKAEFAQFVSDALVPRLLPHMRFGS